MNSQRLTYCLTFIGFLIIFSLALLSGFPVFMKQILILQILVLAVVALISAAFSGLAGFWSAVAGGFSYLIPSAFAVLLLKLSKCNPLYHGKAFIIGEVLKVVLSLVMMLAVFAVWHQSLIFFPFLFGLLSVSHLVFLVLLRVKHYGR